MLVWLIFIIELFVLFSTSRYVSQALFIVFYLILRSEKRAIYPVFILLLPGTIVHELAHYFMAEILFVGAHNIELSPKFENGRLKMGSVQVRKSDIFRQMLIGVAPIIFGISILSLGIYSFFHLFNYSELLSTPLGILTIVFLIYLVFTISNTMFSSKKDLEGFLEFSAIVAFFILVLAIVGFILKIDFLKLSESLIFNNNITNFISLVNWLLFIPVVINLCFVLIAKLLFRGRF